jgi:hypothetical protein
MFVSAVVRLQPCDCELQHSSEMTQPELGLFGIAEKLNND